MAKVPEGHEIAPRAAAEIQERYGGTPGIAASSTWMFWLTS
jgi:hypothetical protein